MGTQRLWRRGGSVDSPRFPAGPGHPGAVLQGRSWGGRFGRLSGCWGPCHMAHAHPRLPHPLTVWLPEGCSVTHADLRSQRLPALGAPGGTQWTVALGVQRISLAWPSLRSDALCFRSSCWALHVAPQRPRGRLPGGASDGGQPAPSLARGPGRRASAGAHRHKACPCRGEIRAGMVMGACGPLLKGRDSDGDVWSPRGKAPCVQPEVPSRRPHWPGAPATQGLPWAGRPPELGRRGGPWVSGARRRDRAFCSACRFTVWARPGPPPHSVCGVLGRLGAAGLSDLWAWGFPPGG